MAFSRFFPLFFLIPFFVSAAQASGLSKVDAYRLSQGQAVSLSLDELTSKIQASYLKMTDLKASFRQETEIPGFKTPVLSEGELFLKKKKKMKLAYRKPKPQEIYILGNEMITYQPGEKQAIRGIFSNEQESKLPVRLLSGEAIFSKEFEIRMETKKGEGAYRLTLIPRRKEEGGLEKIEAEIDPGSYLISSLRLVQSNGNSSAFHFSDIRVNSGIGDILFSFVAPEGTEVLQPFPLPGGEK